MAKATLLIVDNEVSVLKLLTVILKPLDYDVLTAESGSAAFSMMEARFKGMGDLKIDLVITDWKMQGWDGLKLLGEIRATRYGSVPVVLMSGAVTRDELIAAAKNRADAVLVKPIKKDVVIAKVAELIARKPQNG